MGRPPIKCFCTRVRRKWIKRGSLRQNHHFNYRSIVSLAPPLTNQVHGLLVDRVYEEGADMLKTYLVHVGPYFFWVVFVARALFRVYQKSCVKSARKHMGERFPLRRRLLVI